ncbi:MAG: SDR family NAD(P)-dependent oxidoreductase [bacterium]
MNLNRKHAIVTGATSGIGLACAERLAAQGCSLSLLGRREQRLKEIQKKLSQLNVQVDVYVVDMRDQQAVSRCAKSITLKHKVDILINNAGLAAGLAPIEKGSVDDWEQMIDTNLKGLLYISQTIIQHMRENNYGHIVNMGSVAGQLSYPGGNVYSATKAAVHALSDSMNIDLLGTQIKVSCIAPGAVQTEFADVRFSGDKQKVEQVYEGYKPLTAEDIADLIVYVLNTPDHVNIQHTLIMPTAQRSPYYLHRD